VSTPSEGPDRLTSLQQKMVAAGFDTEGKQAALAELFEAHRKLDAHQADLARRTFRGRVQRFGPPVGSALAAGAAFSPQGQEVIGDVGQSAGDTAVAGAEGVGNLATEGYQASVDGLQSAGEAIGREWDEGVQELNRQGEAAKETIVDGAEAAGEGIAEGAGWVGEQATEGYEATVEGAQSAWNGVSGWAVETWGSVSETVTQTAQSVGAWVGQQGDAIAANPTSHALVAAGVAGVVAYANREQIREAVGKAANATNRWARDGFAAAAKTVRGAAAAGVSAARGAAEGAKNLFNEIRNDERVQYVIAKAGMGPRETQQAVSEVNAITAPEPKALPSAAEMQVPPPGQDPAMKPLEGKVMLGRELEAGGSEQGESASPNRAVGTSKKPELGPGGR
jgi:hypothetical protein